MGTPLEMTILVTGAAGFIGFHLARHLLQQSRSVVGLDNVNDYYDVSLKEARLAELVRHNSFEFVRADLADRQVMAELFRRHEFEIVINLAAQAGVRYSLTATRTLMCAAHWMGSSTCSKACRHAQVPALVYVACSSVYGAIRRMPSPTTITRSSRQPVRGDQESERADGAHL